MTIAGLKLQWMVKGADDELAPQRMAVAFARAGDGFEAFGRRIFPKVTKVLEEAVGEQFDAEGHGPARGKWVELTPKYAERKERLYPNRPILVASGLLRDALTNSNSPHALRVEAGADYNFGTFEVPYASYHQTGTRTPMADRPIFDFRPEMREELQRVAAETAREVMRESGLEEFGRVTE